MGYILRGSWQKTIECEFESLERATEKAAQILAANPGSWVTVQGDGVFVSFQPDTSQVTA